MARNLQIGLIGASAERGWAKVSHVPAIQCLKGIELVAVVSTDQAKAEAAAKAFGARAAYGDAQDLFSDDNVDLVTVAVKVPDHRKLVLAAIAAGKHVYCEWPLGRDVAEAEELATAARAAGVHVAVGLQMRMNPAAARARGLIESHAIGRPLSARIVSTTVAFGPKVEAAMAFAETGDNGATLVTIQGAHTTDLAIAVLGELEEGTALATTQYPLVEVGGDLVQQARSIPDHILILARLMNGAPLSIEVAGGRPVKATPSRFEITGEKGTIVLDGGAPRGFQSGRLRLLLNGDEQPVEEGEVAGLPEMAANVAGIYAALRDDIAKGTATAPDFDHAVRLTRMIRDLQSSSRTGTRKTALDWPA